MRFFRWMVLALVAVVLILFAVSNRETVSVGLWPLPAFVELPLYLVVLWMLILGFILGELVAWIGGSRWRREARRSRRRIATLERELDAERVQHSEPRASVVAIPR